MTPNKNLKQYALKETAHCKIHGRTDETQSALPLFFNGSGIEVNVTGSELWIDIDVDFDVYEPWIWTSLNGAFLSRQMLLSGSYSLCLFRGMSPDSVKNIRFFRELQAMSEDDVCRLLVKGFRSDGVFLPVKDRPFKLEFVGDSITSGEGTYGAREDMDWLPMYMSASRDYAGMVSDALDAEYRLISQGGWGVLCGWDNDPRHNLPSRYEKICGLVSGGQNEMLGAGKPYDFQSWIPDAIIVNLGTNDASAFDQPAWTDPATGQTFKQHKEPDGTCRREDLLRFEQAVTDFLMMLRRNNPMSHIVWTYGMLGYDLTLAITDAINTYQKTAGDANIAFLQLPDTTESMAGSRMHPGAKSHARAAQIIIEYLRPILAQKMTTLS
ncbi:MAG: GDSL-type esterase/lipase family protein [Blautia sp.]|nr:GDSL-type esterase/lipase family protein [Blautia sp.]MCM1202437.1 GDSL-type esterase/lipase family protein [Bacteroides fragilis]